MTIRGELAARVSLSVDSVEIYHKDSWAGGSVVRRIEFYSNGTVGYPTGVPLANNRPAPMTVEYARSVFRACGYGLVDVKEALMNLETIADVITEELGQQGDVKKIDDTWMDALYEFDFQKVAEAVVKAMKLTEERKLLDDGFGSTTGEFRPPTQVTRLVSPWVRKPGRK